jgi:hypothetical protein
MQRKNILIAILCVTILFLVPLTNVCGAFVSGLNSKVEVNEDSLVNTSGMSNSAIISLHIFDKTVEKQKKDIVLPVDAAFKINNLFELFKQKIVNEPMSEETKALKLEIVDLFDIYGLIPNGVSKDYVLSLLNPSWINSKQKTTEVSPVFPILKNFVTRILGVFTSLQQFFKMRFGKTASQDIIEDVLPKSSYAERGTAYFCSMNSAGNGAVLPLFLLPRPRGMAVWSSTDGETNAGILISPVGAGFTAKGAQLGIALGFVGLGLTFAVPGKMFYGFAGYALFTSVNADNIESIPPNKKPVILNEKPVDESINVPLSLSELSFRIHDPEGKLMS